MTPFCTSTNEQLTSVPRCSLRVGGPTAMPRSNRVGCCQNVTYSAGLYWVGMMAVFSSALEFVTLQLPKFLPSRIMPRRPTRIIMTAVTWGGDGVTAQRKFSGKCTRRAALYPCANQLVAKRKP